MEHYNIVILILTSFLMGILPILFLWVNNLSEVTAKQMIKFLGLFVLGYSISNFLLYYFIQNHFIVNLILIAVFYLIFFGKPALRSKKNFIIHALCILALVGLFLLSSEKLQLIYIDILFGLELFISIVFGYHLIKYFYTIKSFQPAAAEQIGDIKCKRPYSVYFIIPDEYASFVSLEEIGIDNSEFKYWLQTKGFYVADNAKSNYNLTQNSICSTLNMDYVQNFFTPKDQLDAQSNRTLLFSFIFNNKVGNMFKQLGYKYYHVINNWEGQNKKVADCADVEINIMDSLDFETTLFCRTFFEEAANRFQAKFYRLTHLKIFEQLSEIADKSELKFVYSHMICPHPPFCFDENGNLPESYFNINASYIGKEQDNNKIADEYAASYEQQIKFLNKSFMELIENIQKNDPKSIIIIQGDHGSQYYGFKEKDTLDKPSKALLKHRYSPLRAIYAPADFDFNFESSVNLFRAVFNYITESNEPYIEDKYYFSLSEYFDFRPISKFFLK